MHGFLFKSLPMPPPSTHHHTTTQGPNPSYIEASYHWFDGSGFVHALSMDPAAQTANYSAQFVETSILKVGLSGWVGLAVCIVCVSVRFDFVECASALHVDRCLVGHAHCLQYPPALIPSRRGRAVRRRSPVWMDVAVLGSMAVPEKTWGLRKHIPF